YTINCVLRASSEPLSYRELIVRVQNAYRDDRRDWPSPVIDGSAQDNTILEAKTLQRLTFAVSKRGNKLTVNGGQPHGLTRGTILAVHPPAGEKGKLRGYVKIARLGAVRSEVEPVEYGDVKPPEEKALLNGRCAVEELVYDDLRVKTMLV